MTGGNEGLSLEPGVVHDLRELVGVHRRFVDDRGRHSAGVAAVGGDVIDLVAVDRIDPGIAIALELEGESLDGVSGTTSSS